MVKTFLLVLLSFKVYSQSSSTLMSARSAGIGYASATLADDWAMLNNIGGLAKISQASAVFAYETRPALIGANRMGASISAITRVGAIGASIFKFGDDLYSEHLFSLGFGNKIGNTSIGAKANYIQFRAESFGMTNAISFDFGGITEITKQISVGAYISNITQSKLKGANRAPLPSRLVVGIGFKPTDKIFISSEIEKDLDYQPMWRSGIEYAIYKKVFVRTGFSSNPNAAHAGLGMCKSKIKFDYAIIFNRLIGTAHQASAVYFLSSNKK